VDQHDAVLFECGGDLLIVAYVAVIGEGDRTQVKGHTLGDVAGHTDARTVGCGSSMCVKVDVHRGRVYT